MLTFLIDFLTAIIISIGACFLCIRLAKRLNLIDRPGMTPHKQHSRPTPLAGGMVIILVIVISVIFHPEWLTIKMLGVLGAAVIVFIFGLWDDARVLPFWVKLVGQILAGLVIIAVGLSVHILKEARWEWVNWGITLFWIIGIINGCNFIDSYDGLAIGIGLTMFGSLLVGTTVANQFELVRLITTMLGVLLILFFFNTSPAMLFLGDSGAQVLGLFTAVIAIMFTPKNLPQAMTWYVPIIIAGIPIFDTTLVVISRIRRKKRVYQAGLNHTWHRLVALGLSGHQAVILIHIASLILGCLALLALEVPLIYSISIFLGVLAVGVGLILFLDAKKRWD